MAFGVIGGFNVGWVVGDGVGAGVLMMGFDEGLGEDMVTGFSMGCAVGVGVGAVIG